MAAYTYYIGDTTSLTVPASACTIAPSNCANTTKLSLTSTGTPTYPAGFPEIVKNVDNSFTITMSSSDPLKTGEKYTLLLGFTDSSSVLTVTQPSSPSFEVSFKCVKTVNCSNSNPSSSLLNYFISNLTTKITFAACVINPLICADTMTPSLIPTGGSPPTTLTSVVKKPAPDNSYELTFYSNDPNISGQAYTY